MARLRMKSGSELCQYNTMYALLTVTVLRSRAISPADRPKATRTDSHPHALVWHLVIARAHGNDRG